MFRPISLFIALRYLRSRSEYRFAAFVAWIALLGITLGIAVLIIVLAVMEGFVHDIKQVFLNRTPHMLVAPWDSKMHVSTQLIKTLHTVPEIESMMPYVQGQAVMTLHGNAQALQLYGVNPGQLGGLGDQSDRETLAALHAGQFKIIVSAGYASQHRISVGDHLTLFMPKFDLSILGAIPRYRRFEVAGLFYDQGYRYLPVAMIHLQDAQHLMGMGSDISGIRLWLKDPYQAAHIAYQTQALLPHYHLIPWMDQHSLYFRTVRTEKTMMMIILSLIMLIACFNLVTSLVMLVNSKRSDIAILRTLGMSRASVCRLFIVQGSIIGVIAVMAGGILGVLSAAHISAIAQGIERLFHITLIPQAIYGLDYLPSQIRPWDVFSVMIIALLLSLLSTIYPAWRAGTVHPAEALRYE